MYDEHDIDNAVTAGIFDDRAASRFRSMVALDREGTTADNEYVPLKGGLDDLLIMVALVLMFIGSGSAAVFVLTMLPTILVIVAAPACAGLAMTALWQMSKYFTLVRKVAGPSILLLWGFLGVAWISVSIGSMALRGHTGSFSSMPSSSGILSSTVAYLATMYVGYIHWRRFQISMTPAIIFMIGVAALYNILSNFVWSNSFSLPVFLLCGLVALLFALWWDVSDIYRQTVRSDVAFWLHIVAALLIVHPVFNLLGALDGAVGGFQAITIIAVYILLAVISVIINRRVFIFSGLIYLLNAMWSLGAAGMQQELTLVIATLPIGLTILCLSSHWSKVRSYFLEKLPTLVSAQLPRADLTIAKRRPIS